MKPTFQADADLDQRIVAGLMRLEPSIDFQIAHEARLKSVPDDEVLALCANTGRILVSHDQKTMPAHFATFIASQESPGVIIVPHHMPVGEAVRELYLAWTASEAAEWRNRILRLPLIRSVCQPLVSRPLSAPVPCPSFIFSQTLPPSRPSRRRETSCRSWPS